MELINKILLTFIFLLSISSVTFAWSPDSLYLNHVNITVNNWNYTQGSFTHIAKYVLVSLNSSFANPYFYRIVGYDQRGDFLGNVSYEVVADFGNISGTTQSAILIKNKTDSNQSWDFITLFFNPTHFNGTNTNCFTEYFPNCAKFGSMFKYLLANQIFNYTTNLDCSGPSSCPWGWPSTFVVVTNRSITGDNFNITFITSLAYNNLTANSVSNRYILNSYGAFGRSIPILGINYYSVSSPPISNANTNTIFGSAEGFEGMFGIPSNQIIAEGTQLKDGVGFGNLAIDLFNSTKSYEVNVGNLQSISQYGKFTLWIKPSSPIDLYILPAFSTNYTITTPIENDTLVYSNGCAEDPSRPGWYCDFTQRETVENVSWNYTLKTNALPSNVGNLSIVNYTNIGYALLKIPAKNAFGIGCRNIYLHGLQNYEGAISFYTYACTSNYTWLLIPNKTVNNYAFSSFYLYFDSVQNIGGFSNKAILHNWQFATGNIFGEPYNAMPFIINLSSPFNIGSYVQVSSTTYIAGNSFDTFISTGSTYTWGTELFTLNERSNANDRQMLITNYTIYLPRCAGGPQYHSEAQLYTTSLSINASPSGMGCYSGSYTLANISERGDGGGTYSSTILLNLVYPISANVEHLYSITYNGISGTEVKGEPGINNCTGPNCFPNSTIGNPSPFPVNTLAVGEITPIFPTVTWPKFIISIVAIFALIFFAFTLKNDEITGGSMGLILLFLFGLFSFGYSVVAIALVLLSLFIVYEYSEGRKHGG